MGRGGEGARMDLDMLVQGHRHATRTLSSMSTNMIPVAVVGASGYSGAELVEILLGHAGARIAGVFGSAKREEGGKAQAFSEVWPRFRGRLDLPVRAADVDEIVKLGVRAVFLCTPHEASMELAPKLRERGVVVLDLSAAYRLKDAAMYPKYYGFEHHDMANLERAVYGMPELFRGAIAKSDMIAVPGCYPTSAILALAPLVRAGAIAKGADGRAARVIIDSTSGVSGAGRSPVVRNLFCEVSQQAYSVLKHRHNPEIDAYAGTPTLFTPHLGPYERGILSTIHVELAEGWTESRVRETLAGAYAGERFVRLCAPGVWPSVADVAHTNFCDIGLAVDSAYDAKRPHLVVTSAIDNLLKGAAGQAVQCFNVRFGFDESMALLATSGAANARAGGAS